MLPVWPETIVFGQAGTQPKMAEKRASRKAKSDRVFGQGKNDGNTDALIRKSRHPWASIRSALKRRAMPDDDEHYVYAIALP